MLAEVGRNARGIGVELSALNSIGEPYFDPFGGQQAFQRTLDGLKRDIDICGYVGIRTLAVWEGRPRDGVDLAWHLDTLTLLFTAALEYAHDTLDAIVCEPHPFTVGFARGGLSDLCEAVGNDRFGLILDTCHLSVAFPRDYLARLNPLVPYVKHLHLSDSDLETSELHYPPGAGLVDLTACMQILQDGGFRGTLAWDLFSWPFPERALRETWPAFLRLVAILAANALIDAP
ncbi:MAG: sugar phosphate isomerase/epimerase family protein [Chloroflexota bacterium]|nr:MAG: hypothetical protein DLM70_07175 [Chloroflexota bacterium]